MNIYFNSDVSVSESMIEHLSQRLGAKYNNDVNNNSVDQILSGAKHYIKSQTPDLIVLGFPIWDKELWFNNTPEKNQYHKEHVSNNKFLGAMAKHYNNLIYNFHSELFYLGIPHVFFNCVSSLRCDRDIMTFDWAEFYIKPYQITFNYIDWCRYQGFGSYKDIDANRAWADMLYDHIQQFNLMTKDEHGHLYNLGRQRRRHYGPGVGEWDEELLRPPSE